MSDCKALITYLHILPQQPAGGWSQVRQSCAPGTRGRGQRQ